MRTNSAPHGRLSALSAQLACIVAILSACGGGSDLGSGKDAAQAAPKEQISGTERVKVLAAASAISADAHTKGVWSQVYNWPLIPIHAVTLPDGRIFSYGTNGDGRQTGYFIYDVWDGSGAPDIGHMVLANTTATDLFCSSQVLLPVGGGRVAIAGGDNWNGTKTLNTGNANSSVFDAASNGLSRGLGMNRPRWYSTSTTLVTGEVYVQGGSGGYDFPEVRQVDGSFRLLTTDTNSVASLYPRNFVMPDGRVFGYGSAGNMYWMDPTGNGKMTYMGMLDRQYAGYTSSAAMFRPGRILQIGATNANAAAVIDVTSGKPVITPTQPLSQQRQWVTSTLLPDGTVLATGGSPVANVIGDANNQAEIWNPQTGQWTRGAPGALARLYHSTALLRPDGSVLVGGGGAPGPLNNTNVEIYYPPYLFAADGSPAQRPMITGAPTAVTIGQTFQLSVPNPRSISRVTLVKTSSVTHSYNMDQRFLDLTFKVGDTGLYVQAPTRAGEAPPGYYQVFVLDGNGVPSVSKIVRIGIAPVLNAQVTPNLTNPGAQTTASGTSVALSLVASDPNNDPLSYAAAGLPTGLSINSKTGVISGAPNTPGTYNVVATASDGVNSASATFAWSVTGSGGALVINEVSNASPVLASGSASYDASASGASPKYRWDFGDGTPPTAWSASGSATHVFAKAGSFYVTLSVTDSSKLTQTRSFLQTVYLPPTPRSPTASSTIALETPSGANARLWVVNQDNNSVSVFDAVTQARLAEIATGLSPRTVAVAPNGMIWVTNKQAPSISVIDPASLAIVRTLWMPRATMPFGVAMSPKTAQAFVTLEATGQLLRFDTNTYVQTGAVRVGDNPRHLAVTADGTSVYVSRFITPPLTGESTASVNTTGHSGGMVVKVASASMNVTKTVALHHSERADAENQGRGVPNYLGAMRISPDGTQAYLPSKQDNIKRGGLRDGAALTFQNTVRAVSSRIVMSSDTEDLASRIDHDNASVASAAAFDPLGVYLFVALETSREVAVLDAFTRAELFRFDVGRAPQGLIVAPDGSRLYVNNFMDRTVGVYDLGPLLKQGLTSAPLVATWGSITTEKLPANVLVGKQLFYDARDTRLARDNYLSCATCHNDGGQDGRVWDFTSLGEGLRNTINLRGRGGAQGFRHWSANFDETQDFEGQIRTLAGGTGLMSNALFNAGTRSQPLGDKKAGLSADLDALAAYVASLTTVDVSPFHTSATALSAQAQAGKQLFTTLKCANCHGGVNFTTSGANNTVDIGTIKATSGKRLGAALTGIDIPTLRDVWGTAPYLHDGSAPTLGDAVKAHRKGSVPAISDADLASLTAYLLEIGRDEVSAP